MAKMDKYSDYAYFEGEIVPFDDAKVSVATNALQYGIGLFGGVKGYYDKDNKAINIFRLDDHIKRLQDSAKILRFKRDFDAEEIEKAFIELVKKNKPDSNVYFRPYLYRSDIDLGPNLGGDYEFTLYMAPFGDYFDKSKGVRAMISSWVRNSDNALPPRTKASGGYINSALATDTAKAAGYDAAIMMDQSGHISEGAVMNFYMVKDGKLITTGVSSDILEGITRRTIIKLAKEMGIEVEQRVVDRTELYTADEIFFSGTATEITWCESVDDVVVSDEKGEVVKKLEAAFYDLVYGRHDDSKKMGTWVTIG